jgi:putative DNA primase/helicase
MLRAVGVMSGEPVWLPSPDQPMAAARAIADQNYSTGDGILLLRHWRGGWWRWRTTHWTEIEHRAVRAELYATTENAVYPVKDRFEPWDPNRRKIADLAEALAAITYLDDAAAQPQWLVDPPIPPGAIVACRNGLLHVESRILHEHTPHWFGQTAVPFDYDPMAPDPARWLKFLDDLWPDDGESIAALQEFTGYVLSGHTHLQKILLLIGPTRAGKGAIVRILAALVGRGNMTAPTPSSLGGEFGLAPLIGKPLPAISDARLDGRGANVVVERLLTISGEDAITVNRKYRDQWTGTLPTRFVILSNELPHFGDASAAIVGRFIPLMLTRSWLGREDHDLEPAMHAELPGILNWCLDGLARLSLSGGVFTRPAATDEVLLTLANLASPVGAFVRDCCERAPLHAVPADRLYKAWKAWADDNGHKAGTAQVFGRNLRAVIPELRVERPREGEQRHRRYRGVTLRGEY